MNQYVKKYIIMVSVLVLCGAGSAFAETTKINNAIGSGTKLDNKKITVEGEAIGHIMKKGEFAWVNINDKTASIGIWASCTELSQIRNLGKHAVTGDWIRAYGIFNSHCPEHGGDADIHADSLTVVTRGGPRDFAYDQEKADALVFLIGVLICLYIIKILKRRH